MLPLLIMINSCFCIALMFLFIALTGCTPVAADQERCLSCHKGIEHTSPSHSGCVSCHGGNPNATTKNEAHSGIYGLSNRSYPGRWELGCGKCHQSQLQRMQSSQMYTAAGMIAQTQATWEGETPDTRYGSQAAELYDPAGKPLKQHDVEIGRAHV